MGLAAVTQQELESRLWAAANSLRGPVDPADFKAYIFPLLFYKRICDAWDDEHARAVADFGGDGSTATIEADYHRFQSPTAATGATCARSTRTSASRSRTSSTASSRRTPTRWPASSATSPGATRTSCPSTPLLNLIEAFDTLDLRPSRVGHDVLGNAYEYLLKQFADESGKKAGEFFTPRSVVRLLTRILDPQPTDTVYDPACGSGGMLVEAANEVIEAGGSLRQMRFYLPIVRRATGTIPSRDHQEV